MAGIRKRLGSILGPEGKAGTTAANIRFDEIERKSDNAINRVEHLETLGGLAPGEVTDAQTANLIHQPSSTTHAAVRDSVQRAAAPADAGTVVDIWEPPAQNAGPDLTQYDADDLYTEWDALIDQDPDYVTKYSIGNGTDGLPIYAYAFTPPSPGNTVLLTAEHGGEKIAMYAALQMLKLMVTDWQHHPALAALRARTRIVVVPVVSRSAFNSNSRKNANGVDLNRNWDYRWSDYPSSPSDTTYKGPAPFSEPETQALRDLIYTLEADGGLVAALDLHDTGAGAKPEGYHFFVNAPHRTQRAGASWIRELANQIAHQQGVHNSNTAITLSDQPQMMSWCAERGLWSATVEYEQRWGTEGMDSDNQTAALRWIGNIVIRAASQDTVTTQNPQPWIKRLTFSAGSSRIALPPGSGAGHDIAELGYEFVPECAGIVEFYGHIYVGGANAAQVTVTPAIGQSGTQFGHGVPNVTYDSLYVYHQGGYSEGGLIVPFSVSHPVVENPQWPVRVQIYAHSNPGESVVYRYRGNIKFTPSTSHDRFELYSATGRGGQGLGAMQLIRGI